MSWSPLTKEDRAALKVEAEKKIDEDGRFSGNPWYFLARALASIDEYESELAEWPERLNAVVDRQVAADAKVAALAALVDDGIATAQISDIGEGVEAEASWEACAMAVERWRAEKASTARPPTTGRVYGAVAPPDARHKPGDVISSAAQPAREEQKEWYPCVDCGKPGYWLRGEQWMCGQCAAEVDAGIRVAPQAASPPAPAPAQEEKFETDECTDCSPLTDRHMCCTCHGSGLLFYIGDRQVGQGEYEERLAAASSARVSGGGAGEQKQEERETVSMPLDGVQVRYVNDISRIIDPPPPPAPPRAAGDVEKAKRVSDEADRILRENLVPVLTERVVEAVCEWLGDNEGAPKEERVSYYANADLRARLRLALGGP